MKQFFKLSLTILLLLAGTAVTFAQKTVTGTVTSGADGTPLIGATVLVKGTGEGTITDIDGNFSLQAPSTGSVLVISFTGYESQEVNIAGLSVINVSLAESTTRLAEIVVTGYTAQKKRDLIGAVGVVNTEDLRQIPSSNINSQLQGKVSGVIRKA